MCAALVDRADLEVNIGLKSPSSRDDTNDSGQQPIEWKFLPSPADYLTTVAQMEQTVKQIATGSAPEQVWLLEHPPLYSAGTSADYRDLIDQSRFPVFKTGRGGQFTYHGPGQRVVYVMLDLKRRGRDVRLFVWALEQWIIETLDHFKITGERRKKRVGVWVADGHGCEDKIAAIGVRIRRWVTFHGISLNITPNLDHYDGITPCGINDGPGITSLARLGVKANMSKVDEILKVKFDMVFNTSKDVLV